MANNVLAIIPARGCNDEVDHMNLRELGGKPLVWHTINQAQKSKNIGRVIVSTEDDKVRDLAILSGAEVPFKRPDKFCNGETSITDIVLYTIEKLNKTEEYDCEIIVVLFPNTPLKSYKDIDNMINQLNESNLDAVIPFCKKNEFFWTIKDQKITPINFQTRKKRIDADVLYEENGGIYVYKRAILNSDFSLLNPGTNIGFYEISKHNAQTIHTTYDFFILEKLIRLPTGLIDIITKSDPDNIEI